MKKGHKWLNACRYMYINMYISYLQKYKIIWWNTKIGSDYLSDLVHAWPTFQQEHINQIVVVSDAFFVDSTIHTSIFH